MRKYFVKQYASVDKDYCVQIYKLSRVMCKYLHKSIVEIYGYIFNDTSVGLIEQYIPYSINLDKQSIVECSKLICNINKSINIQEIKDCCFQRWNSNEMLERLISGKKLNNKEYVLYTEMSKCIRGIKNNYVEGVIHGDYRIDNIRRNKTTYTVIDLDTFALGDIRIDVGRFLVDLYKQNRIDLADLFSETYCKNMQISKKDIEGSIEVALWVKILWLKDCKKNNYKTWDKRLIQAVNDMYAYTNNRNIKKIAGEIENLMITDNCSYFNM